MWLICQVHSVCGSMLEGADDPSIGLVICGSLASLNECRSQASCQLPCLCVVTCSLFACFSALSAQAGFLLLSINWSSSELAHILFCTMYTVTQRPKHMHRAIQLVQSIWQQFGHSDRLPPGRTTKGSKCVQHQKQRRCSKRTVLSTAFHGLNDWGIYICRAPNRAQYPPWPTRDSRRRRRQSSAIGVLLLCINIVARTELRIVEQKLNRTSNVSSIYFRLPILLSVEFVICSLAAIIIIATIEES